MSGGEGEEERGSGQLTHFDGALFERTRTCAEIPIFWSMKRKTKENIIHSYFFCIHVHFPPSAFRAKAFVLHFLDLRRNWIEISPIQRAKRCLFSLPPSSISRLCLGEKCSANNSYRPPGASKEEKRKGLGMAPDPLLVQSEPPKQTWGNWTELDCKWEKPPLPIAKSILVGGPVWG